jgi:hypothetical protein
MVIFKQYRNIVRSRKNQIERQVCTLKRITVFVLIILLFMVSSPGEAFSSSDSYVIGRIIGTYQPMPGYFYKHPYALATGFGEVEFTGFRLVRKEDGKKFTIRPNNNGFYYQKLPGGEYTLTRKRTDRPNYKTQKTIDVLSFGVKTDTLVNLGTIKLIVNDKPHESLSFSNSGAKGKYSYTYKYERKPGADTFNMPLDWFRQKKSKIAARFENRVELENGAPTGEWDGSRVVLRLFTPHDDR